MSWRGTVLLALVVGATIFAAYREVVSEDPAAGWSTVLEEPLPTPPGRDVEPLIELDVNAVTGIRLRHHGSTTVFERTAYGWTGTSAPAAVDEFLVSVAKLAVILRIEGKPSTDDLAAYGLDQPTDRITLTVANRPPIAIALGHHNPSATGIYALVSPSDEIVLTGAVAMWEIEKLTNALASTR